MPTLEHWRRVHVGTPRPATPRWAAPAAAAGIVLTAVGLWAQLPRHRPSATSAALEPVASPPPTRQAPPSMTTSRPGGVIETAGGRWQVGSTDDQVLQGDWDCDGRATLALLRPTTGDIYRFDGWSPPDTDVRGTPVARRVPGARSLRAGDLNGDRCDDLLIEAADGTTIAVGDAMRTRAAALLSLAAWSGLAAAAVVVLRASVVVPDGRPISLAFELLRRVALAAAWYVLALTCAGALARGLRAVSVVRALDALTVAPLRHTLRAALGVGLAGALAVSGPAIATAAPDDPPIVTLHRLPPSPTSTTATTAVAPPVTWAADRRRPPAAPVAAPTTTPPRHPEIPPGASVWQVRPGDCFWTIAESVLATRLARPVTEREIVPYWQRLIAENRARLRDTDNPDLIFPGQSFVVARLGAAS